MNKKIYIATVGHNCIDFYDNTGEFFPGGNPVNVAVYIKRMQGNSSYTGVVGTDKFGRFMVDSLSKKGVDISHLKVLPGNTAVTHVEIKNGDRILGDYDEGVMADFKLSNKDIDFLCSHDLVVSGIWGMIESDLYKLKAKNVPIAFDFADKINHQISRIALPWVDYAFFSDDFSKDEDIKNAMKNIKKIGPKIVIFTRGTKGSIAYDGNNFFEFGIFDCKVIDSMGAGDSYIAGFLMSLLNGVSIEGCMKNGALSSSITLGYKGAW